MRRLIACIILLASAEISNAADVTAFVSPDSSFAALSGFLRDAKDLKIATYTFTSQDIAELISGNVTILVDAAPAGGFPAESMAVLCGLAGRGASVLLYDGPLRFMHAKYIVKDGVALITSENLGGDGFPPQGGGNRGWGVIVEDESIARQLENVFLTDLKDSKPLVCDSDYIPRKKESGSYRLAFSPQRFENQSVSLIVAPGAVQPLLDLMGSAQSRLLAEQFYIHRYFDRKTQSDNPLLEALISAARRNVTVSVLLDSFSYNVESDDSSSNLYTEEYLNNVSMAESLPLRAKLISLDNGLLKLHNKGLIADDAVLVSSINWNQNSPTRNREVGVVVRGKAADYFAAVFDYDFRPKNRITGLAAAGNYGGLALVIFIILVMGWLKTRRRY